MISTAIYVMSPQKSNRVIFGLTRRVQLSNANGLFIGYQKEVRRLVFRNKADIERKANREILQEAILLDHFLLRRT